MTTQEVHEKTTAVTDKEYFTMLANIAILYGFEAANAVRDVGREDRDFAILLGAAALSRPVLEEVEKNMEHQRSRRGIKKPTRKPGH